MATVAKNTRSSTVTLVSPSPGPFTIGYRLFDTDSVRVYVDGLVRTDWTLTATFAGGYDDIASITFDADLPIDSVITIDAALIPWRQDDLVNGDGALVQKLNAELGRVWSSLAEIRRDTDRSVRGFNAIDPTANVDFTAIAEAPTYAALAEAAATAAAASAASAEAAENSILKPRGQWLTATDYLIGDLVSQSGSQYEVIVNHTSGVFATDLAANKMRIFVSKGDAGAGAGDVVIANNGSEYTPNAGAFRQNLEIPYNRATKITGSNLQVSFTEGGIYTMGASNTNAPSGAADGDMVLHKRLDANNAMSVYFFKNGGGAIASKVSGVWGPWVYFPTTAYVDAAVAGASQIIHVVDEKASGTPGGTFTQGVYLTRTLNTVRTNTISGASLASNRITLPAGTYDIDATAPAAACNQHRAILYNITGTANLLLGTSEYAAKVYGAASASRVRGRFTLGVTTELEIRHAGTSTQATNGFGVATLTPDNEVYTDVMIGKVS